MRSCFCCVSTSRARLKLLYHALRLLPALPSLASYYLSFFLCECVRTSRTSTQSMPSANNIYTLSRAVSACAPICFWSSANAFCELSCPVHSIWNISLSCFVFVKVQKAQSRSMLAVWGRWGLCKLIKSVDPGGDELPCWRIKNQGPRASPRPRPETKMLTASI